MVHCQAESSNAARATIIAGFRPVPILDHTGVLASLEAFGATVTADTCIVVAPLAKPGGTMMTNSAKYAHYGPGIIGVDSVFGDSVDCIESAVAGRVVREDGPWA